MLPVVIAFFGELIAPEWLVAAFMGPVPFRVMNPYMALVYAVMILYLPFGISVLLKMKLTKGKVDNVDPRKQAQQLAATNPMFKRLQNAESNMQEGFSIFAPALLAAVQAGVSPETVGLYATFWLVDRCLYIMFYMFGSTALVSYLRSASFIFSLATTTKLLYLAAAASS